MLDPRPVLFICGILLTALSVAMLFPALTDIARGDIDWQPFVRSAAVTLFVGVGLMLATRTRRESMRLNLRQAFLFTTLSWLVLAAFAALPFSLSRLDLSYTDAFFESMSGITTTGSTVITGLDTAPPGILLWRAMLQWLGGIGIIVVAVAILPMLRVGGMQMFKVEAFDTPEKVMPRAAQLALGIGLIYAGLTIAATIALWIAGMSLFDAVAHAMTSIATGGFSTRDASVGGFDDYAIDWIFVVIMILGSLPFVYYVDVVRGHWKPFSRDSQIHWFLTILVGSALLVFLWLWQVDGFRIEKASAEAAFNVTSIMTGTGYATADFALWGALPTVLLFTLMFVGGCAGSTTCGIKVFRFQVAYAVAKTQIARLTQPHGVFIPYYNRKPISQDVAASVMGFFFVFVASFAALALALSLTGVDFLTALSGAASAIANVGPGLGQVIGPAGNFSTLPDTAKWLLAAGMLLGRLELFTVLILFAPRFWRS